MNGFSADEARRVGEEIGVDWASAAFDVEELQRGMDVELEHGLSDPRTTVTELDRIVAARIALAHLAQHPDYYSRLELEKREVEGNTMQIKPCAPPAQPPQHVSLQMIGGKRAPLADAAPGIDESVLRWRQAQLLRAGYDASDADLLARHADVDLHYAIDLVRRGCPPGTARRILS